MARTYLLPQTEWCNRCIDRRIAQAACIMKVLSNESNYKEEKRAYEALLLERSKIVDEQGFYKVEGKDNG